LGQQLRERGDISLVMQDLQAQLVAELATEFIGVSRQRKERGVARARLQRYELMPGFTGEANGEDAVRRYIDMVERANEAGRICLDLFWRRARKAQLRAPAPRDGGEDAMARMPMKRVASPADSE
jgi:hypothetical protein